jgi:hypothetical protein
MGSLEDAMVEHDIFLELVGTAFPLEPLPTEFFWSERKDRLDLDIPQELGSRISGRSWTNVTLQDWRMIGVSPAVARHYLEPATFMYYVPSIIIGALQQIDCIEFALEAIVPGNRNREPRGKWWSQFSASASPRQRATLAAFTGHARLTHWDTIGPSNQSLLEHAENIWTS